MSISFLLFPPYIYSLRIFCDYIHLQKQRKVPKTFLPGPQDFR